ncbi:hypothetical protein HJ019_23120 [Vibrio parahaemolyticus]|nr:hypothetical protein [Vibrio parahaemolyticus]
MDLNLFFGIVTVLAFGVAIHQYRQAHKSDKKLEEANSKLEKTQESLKEIENEFLLSDFKLKKAMEFYDDGHYKNSLELFRKYSNESEDLSELKEVIRKIFWAETRKIYSKYMGKGWTPEMLVMTIISRKESTESKYPDFLVSLLDVYTAKTDQKLALWRVPILLNQDLYSEVIDFLPDFKAQYVSKKANESFRSFVEFYCNRQLSEA